MSTWNEQSNQPDAGHGADGGDGRGRAAETVVQATGREPGELASEIGEAVRRNCVPLALIGLGAVWLAASQARGRHADDDLRDAASAAGSAGRRAASYARSAGSTARTKAADARDRLRTGASDGGYVAREKAQGAMEGVRSVYQRNPLLVGLLTAGGTAALAAAIAIRRNDGRVMQEVQQQAKAAGRQAAGRAREEAEKVRTVAERTARATRETAREVASEEAKREGLAGADRAAGGSPAGGTGGASSGSGSGSGSSAGRSG